MTVRAPCLVCERPTGSKARCDLGDRIVTVAMCQPCQDLAHDVRDGGSGRTKWHRRLVSWLPRMGVLPNCTTGLDDCNDPRTLDFDGRSLVIVWGRFVFEVFLGKRP